jgi:hypothetical protein
MDPPQGRVAVATPHTASNVWQMLPACEHLFGPELRHLDRSVERQLQDLGVSPP